MANINNPATVPIPVPANVVQWRGNAPAGVPQDDAPIPIDVSTWLGNAPAPLAGVGRPIPADVQQWQDQNVGLPINGRIPAAAGNSVSTYRVYTTPNTAVFGVNEVTILNSSVWPANEFLAGVTLRWVSGSGFPIRVSVDDVINGNYDTKLDVVLNPANPGNNRAGGPTYFFFPFPVQRASGTQNRRLRLKNVNGASNPLTISVSLYHIDPDDFVDRITTQLGAIEECQTSAKGRKSRTSKTRSRRSKSKS